MPLIQSFSGIRGIYNNGIDEDIARKYAIAYKEFLLQRAIKSKTNNQKPITKNPIIVIARDTRHSGKAIFNAISEVFSSIIDLGIATTPMAELAVREYKADGGIIITASHNEPEWNGLKFLDNDGAVLRAKDADKLINKFKEISNSNKRINLKLTHKKEIKDRHSDIISKYISFIQKIIGKQAINSIKNSKIRFIIDPNGGAGVLAKEVLEKLGIKFQAININAGIFNRKIEPNEGSLSYLKDIIKRQGLDIGFGFDCDADRVEAVHSECVVSGNYLLALCVDEMLASSKSPENDIVVVNDATSNILKFVTDKYKARLIETDVGEINVIDTMLRHGSIIGGEGSSAGVIIMPSTCRDGILTMLFLLNIIAKSGQSIQEILDRYPKYTTIRKDLIIEQGAEPYIKNYLAKYYKNKGYNVKKRHSIKVYIDENTFLWFRLSKTENNKFRIIVDSNSMQKANELILEAYTRVTKLTENLNSVE